MVPTWGTGRLALLVACLLSTGCGARSQPTPAGHTCDPACAEGLACCDERVAGGVVPWCVDLSSAPAHCGACGNACLGGATCHSGTCSCEGTTACDGACVSLDSDGANCGGCGRLCGRQAPYCVAGACVKCQPPTVDCGDGVCSDFTRSQHHCGACDRDCGPSATCLQGACVSGDGSACPDCTDGRVCCAGACVSLGTRENCGGCGMACDSPGEPDCVGGRCTVILI